MKAGYITSIVTALALGFVAAPDALASPPPYPTHPEWTAPIAPFRIADNLYYVGSQDLTAYLVVTPKGLILLDVGVPQNAPMVIRNIRSLGFDPRQIKYLLNSHAHFDHAGGLAEVKHLSHAQMVASQGDAGVLESGGRTDFFFGPKPLFPKVKVDRIVGDGDTVTLGGVSMTAHLTPGHTKGCTTWSLPLTADGQTRQALFLCSLSILEGYKLTGDPKYPRMGADFAHSYAVLHRLPCEVFLAAHGSMYDLLKKRQAMTDHPDAPNPFIDPAGCKAVIDRGEADFNRKMAAKG